MEEEFQENSMHINNIPNEILEKIFLYVKAEDVLTHIRETCSRRKKITENNEFIKKLVYIPSTFKKDSEVITFIQIAPKIRHFIFRQLRNYSQIFDAIYRYSEDVKTIVIQNKAIISKSIIGQMLEKFKKLERLEVYTSEGVHVDYARTEGNVYSQKRSLILYPHNFNDAHVVNVILADIEDLQILTIYCNISSEILSSICIHSNLKYLFIVNRIFENLEAFVDISPLSSLNKLETLQLLAFPYSPRLAPNTTDLFKYTFSNLTKLEVVDAGSMLESCINSFLEVCPQLIHLNVKDNLLKQTQLENITMCSNLEFLDVSNNYALGDDFLRLVGESCPKLKFIDFSNCRVTDGFIFALSGCREMETMVAEGRDFTGLYFHHIATMFPKLSHFVVKHFSLFRLNVLRDITLVYRLLKFHICNYDPEYCIHGDHDTDFMLSI